MLPEPSPVGGGGRRNELCPSAREALPPGGTSLNLSERHARARPHVGGGGGARGGPPPVPAGQAGPPTPIPPLQGHHTATCRGLRLFLGAYAAVGRATAHSCKGDLLKFSVSPCPYR